MSTMNRSGDGGAELGTGPAGGALALQDDRCRDPRPVRVDLTAADPAAVLRSAGAARLRPVRLGLGADLAERGRR